MQIEPHLLRYPAVDPASFRVVVYLFCHEDLLACLPGESTVRQGLGDLADGQPTASACLISIAHSRFRQAGLIAPGTSAMADPELQLYPRYFLPRGAGASAMADPELQLYRLLRSEGGDAYSRYNALLRELISFEQALDHRLRRQEPGNLPRLATQS